jgi:hypothetical protein
MADKEILRFKNSSGALITPITKIGAGSGVTIVRAKDTTGTYELDEIVISATGGGGSTTINVEGTNREVEINDRINADLSTTKVLRLETALKLRDETLTFGGAYDTTAAGNVLPTTIDPFTLFFHKVTI